MRNDTPSEPAEFTIGELATRTGLSVKLIRHWSDLGIAPPAGRSASGCAGGPDPYAPAVGSAGRSGVALEMAPDPGVERYWQLIRLINGLPACPGLAARGEWLMTAPRTANGNDRLAAYPGREA